MPSSTNLRDPERERIALDRDAWSDAGEDVTQGLDWHEIQKLEMQPYDFVAAVPVRRSRDGGEVVGVLAVDGPERVFLQFCKAGQVQRLISSHIHALRDELADLYYLLRN